jgi:hypothetical protein
VLITSMQTALLVPLNLVLYPIIEGQAYSIYILRHGCALVLVLCRSLERLKQHMQSS